MRTERIKLINKRQEERIREIIKKTEEEDEASIKNTERIVELISKSKENMEAKIKFEEQNKLSEKRDRICLAILAIVWLLVFIYQNWFMKMNKHVPIVENHISPKVEYDLMTEESDL